jgi:exodeoxyribonuclease-5
MTVNTKKRPKTSMAKRESTAQAELFEVDDVVDIVDAVDADAESFTVDWLSPDQRTAYDAIAAWASDSFGQQPVLTMGGYAGSGKSTLLATFINESTISPVALCAFTGKAASVLRRKLYDVGIKTTMKVYRKDEDDYLGLPYCGTIHGLVYAPLVNLRCDKCQNVTKGYEENDGQQCKEKAADGVRCTGRIESIGSVGAWTRREVLDRPYKLIVVDEASMVSDDVLEDLKMFGLPILAVGDHGQLPPVNGLGTLMRDPDIRLEKIHRQAEDNPIIKLSKHVRETGRLDTKLADGKHIIIDRASRLERYLVERYKNVEPEKLFDMSIICYTNRRRAAVNIEIRKIRGLSGPPKKGDQVICLRNQKERNVYNGMRALVIEDAVRKNPNYYPWQYSADLNFVDDAVVGNFIMCANQFGRDKTFSSYDELREVKINVGKWDDVGGLFDWGYCLTCHKSQGSSFRDVILIMERPPMIGHDDWRRWAYTAITRSSDRLTILL